MIVVAIIAILAAVAVPNFLKYRRAALRNKCYANREMIKTASESYLIANGKYPESVLDLIDREKGEFLKIEPTCVGVSYELRQVNLNGVESIEVDCKNEAYAAEHTGE